VIYLDYQATTPLAPEACDAMLPWLTADGSANPHSAHVAGRAAKAAVELAREQIAALLPPGGTLIFTSGATEAINLAIKGAGRTIAGLATEHAAVLDCVQALGGEVIPVDAQGLCDFPQTTNAGLFAAMLVNNEIGVIQDVARLADATHRHDALLLCDAVQGYGRVPIPHGPDLIAISAHKIYGPKGIGALWVRDGVELQPLMHGGGQEQGLRSGTLSPALCAGFGAAAALAAERMVEDEAHVEQLWQIAVGHLSDWQINGSVEHRYHGNLNIRRGGLDAGRIISELRDIAISAGSACASGPGRPSHVLKALGLSRDQARSSLRIGFGRYTNEAELTEALDRINASADAQALRAA
jgi:cysteine desulfurase